MYQTDSYGIINLYFSINWCTIGPGPTVMVVVSTSITHGRNRGLQTVAGSSLAMLIQLFVAALGTSWLVSSLATGFFWL